MLWLIQIYQKYISPSKKEHMQVSPTCSQYAYEAIKIHGPFKGLFLSLKRILKCHPFIQAI